MLLRNRAVTLFSPYVVLLSAFYDKELLANIFFSLIWKGRLRQSIMSTAYSVSHSRGIAQCRTDGLNSDPVVIRLITCQPNCGHQANETHLVSLIQGLVLPDRSGGSAGSLVAVFADGHYLGCVGRFD